MFVCDKNVNKAGHLLRNRKANLPTCLIAFVSELFKALGYDSLLVFIVACEISCIPKLFPDQFSL